VGGRERHGCKTTIAVNLGAALAVAGECAVIDLNVQASATLGFGLVRYTAGLGFYSVVNTCGAADVNALVEYVFDDQCSPECEIFQLDPRAHSL
jgi:cellulose biosynthesis protein BcsQ